MKRPKDYKPQFSLSIQILKKAIGAKETNAIIKKYTDYKKGDWKKTVKGK